MYDEFAKALVEKVAAFKLGNGFDAGVTHGPLIHGAGVDKVERHVKSAVASGAKVLIGGKRAVVPGNEGGAFFEPTGPSPCLLHHRHPANRTSRFSFFQYSATWHLA